MAQITHNLVKKRLRQVIFIGCPTFNLSHHKKGLSAKSCLEIFNPDHEVPQKSRNSERNMISTVITIAFIISETGLGFHLLN